MDNVQPMDGLDFLSLAVTAVVSYLVLFLLTKLVGNKQISQMTMFDYISGISVGSIAAEMATEPESPLRPLTGMVVYGLLAWGIALWTNKSLAARRAFTGKPLILYDGGTLYREHLKRAKLDLSEFLTLCRAGGWFDLSQLAQGGLPRRAADRSFALAEAERAHDAGHYGRRGAAGESAVRRQGRGLAHEKAARAGLFCLRGGLPCPLRRKRRGPTALSDRDEENAEGRRQITNRRRSFGSAAWLSAGIQIRGCRG